LLDAANHHHHRHSDVRKDRKRLINSEYHWRLLAQPTLQQAERLAELYTMLYIQKYSRQNPQYTAWGFLNWLPKFLNIYVLEQNGRIDGFAALQTRGYTMTSPLVGYDTRLPQGLGLYRLLVAAMMRHAEQHRLLFHLSSGAAGFKRQRGAVNALEYSAVYVRHLSKRRRWTWYALAKLLNHLVVPALQRLVI
jgi:hypothetical protein